MTGQKSNPRGPMMILAGLGLLAILVGFVNPMMAPPTRLVLIGAGGLLACWGILGLLNLSGVDLDTQPYLKLRRDSPGQMLVRMQAKGPLSGAYLFAFTPNSEELSPLSSEEATVFPLALNKRGKHGGITLSLYAPFPFGPGLAGHKNLDIQIRVLPCYVPAHYLNLPKLTSEFDRARLLRGSRDGAFKGIAEYTREHSIKEVNWKASARAGKLVVNEYEGVIPSRKVLVAPDPTAQRSDFEFVLDFTYSLLEVMHNDWQVYLYCFDGTIFHLPKNSIGAVEDYFLDLYPLGNRPNPDLEFPGLKILVTHSQQGKGPYLNKNWRILKAYDILRVEETTSELA